MIYIHYQVVLPYADIPGFPVSTAPGHQVDGLVIVLMELMVLIMVMVMFSKIIMLDNFSITHILHHQGKLIIGRLNGMTVILMQVILTRDLDLGF